MADEVKKVDAKKGLATFLKVVLGLVFLGIGLWAVLKWYKLLLMIIKGCIGLFFILAGVITLAIAKE
jgi:fatty acid desaturase